MSDSDDLLTCCKYSCSFGEAMYYLKPIEFRGKTLLMEVKFNESWV